MLSAASLKPELPLNLLLKNYKHLTGRDVACNVSTNNYQLSTKMQSNIDKIWDNISLLDQKEMSDIVIQTIELLDKGELRIAEKINNKWTVNEWVKKAIILYFVLNKTMKYELFPFEYNDKIALKKDYDKLGVRVLPGAIARYGSFIAKGVIMMPSFVNIGAYVDSGTMVDTWATVGSCAQIGKNVHLSGGVGIGGVLEPVQAAPVIIEDDCFIGSRSIIVEGVIVEKESVIGANVVLTKSTRIIDVSGSEPKEIKGIVPAESVVIPGSSPKQFPAGVFNVTCALIIGKRKESTDLKTSLNDALRDYNVLF